MNLWFLFALLNLKGLLLGAIDYKKDFDGCLNSPSPIDIPFYNTENRIIYQPYPSHYINRTYYSPLNKEKLEIGTSVTPEDGTFRILAKNTKGNVYVTIGEKYLSYSLQEVRFHVYSEHTLEGMKTELEMQLIHKSNEDLPSSGLEADFLGISVLFSAAWDEDSDFLSVLAKDKDIYSPKPEDRYEAIPITSMDLNQFFRNKDPYYYYTGTGTIPSECEKSFHWFIMKKVEKMSWKQLEQIQSLMFTDYPNGNSKKTVFPSRLIIEYVESKTMISFAWLSLLFFFTFLI